MDTLYENLVKEKEEYQILRDKMNLNYGGLISQFMKETSEKGTSLWFLSLDKYIHSPYCMWELYEIGRNCNFDKELFSQRILPIPVEFFP